MAEAIEGKGTVNNHRSSEDTTASQIPLRKTKRTRISLPNLPKIEPKEEAKFSDIFTKSDIHGVPDWYEAPNWSMKFAWTVILITAITFLTLELYQTIRDFLDNPILTTYSFVNEPAGMPFPEIYICPSNPIHRTTQKNLKVDGIWERKNTEGLLKILSNITGLSGLLAAKVTQSDLLASFRPYSRPFKGPGNGGRRFTEEPELWIPEKIEDYFKAAGYPVDRFIHECAFNSVPFDCAEFITEVFDADYGKCFLIQLNNSANGSETRPKQNISAHQTVAGVGLSLVLDLNFEDGYPSVRNPQPLYDGVLFKVGEKVDPGTDKVLLIHPATYSTVELEGRKIALIDRVPLVKTAQLCTDKKEAAEKLKILDSHYFSTGTCINDCAQQMIVEECDCFLLIDRRYLNEKYRKQDRDICRPDQMKECVGQALNKTRDRLATCTLGCHVPCQYWDYKASASAAAFPTHNLKEDFDEQYFGDSSYIQPPGREYPHQCSWPKPVQMNQRNCTEGESAPFARRKREATGNTTDTIIVANDTSRPTPIPDRLRPLFAIIIEHWYWDRQTEDCLPIEHHWCPNLDSMPSAGVGNNNFETRTQCLHTCAYGNACFAEPSFVGEQFEDQHPTARFAWNSKHQRCARHHSYGEINVNGNNFESRLDCERTCNATRDDPCNIDTEFHCLIRDLYSFEAGDCVMLPPFAVGNCSQPTSNTFDTYYECRRTCTYSNEVIDACNKPAFEPAVHLCPPPELRYFHNARLGICQIIPYSGCPFAKGNIFETEEQCQRTCVKPIVKPANWKPNISYPGGDEGSDEDKETTNSPIQGISPLKIDCFKWRKGDLIILDVAFSSLQYIQLTQDRSMTLTSFVSNVGGQVGLWVGCSVVTIVKLFIVIAPICCCRKRKSPVDNIPTNDDTC